MDSVGGEKRVGGVGVRQEDLYSALLRSMQSCRIGAIPKNYFVIWNFTKVSIVVYVPDYT